MRKLLTSLTLLALTALAMPAQAQTGAQTGVGVTIYNDNFAVVRDKVALDLKAGDNEVSHTGITAHLEPDSVTLRDPAGKSDLRILEQNYRADPVSQSLLLSLFEGKTIDFQVERPNGPTEIVQGKIVRSGYTPHYGGMARYGQDYAMAQSAAVASGSQPIIEVNGKLQFTLPGLPLFPALGDQTILKPTLNWTIASAQAGHIDAELSYVTAGMSWKADYNIVAPEQGDKLDLTAWITMDNQTGKDFDQAKIKLVAGDVNKVREKAYAINGREEARMVAASAMPAPSVTEKTFDEYHLYTLERPTTLRDRETKQVEFAGGAGIASKRIYVYDGFLSDWGPFVFTNGSPINNPEYGTQSNHKVWVLREFENKKENGLGLPLPKGRVRFYRQDNDGRLEFTGENVIDHTPQGETVRLYTGNAFDLVGERKRVSINVNDSEKWINETFEIKVRNRKKEPAEVRVVEHLYRWTNWSLTEHSQEYQKKDSQTVEFPATIQPDAEATITYTVHYTW